MFDRPRIIERPWGRYRDYARNEPCTVLIVEMQPGDSYLLCSDGLYDLLPDEDLRRISESALDPETAVAWLVDAANQAGGTDNITALLMRVVDSARTRSQNPRSQ